ncbi:MAG: amidase family protein, partial [Pseudomonadota bacterium]
EASSNLARFDGARYGYRAPEYSDLIDMYKKTRAQGFGAEVKRRIMIGTYALSAGYYDAYYLKAQQLRRLIAEDFKQAFEACDVILGPTSPTTAFKLGEKSDDPVAMYLSDIYTISVNLAGLPGMSIPAGFDAKGLPVGLQLIGQYFGEEKLLNVAHLYQQATDWHRRIPKGFE